MAIEAASGKSQVHKGAPVQSSCTGLRWRVLSNIEVRNRARLRIRSEPWQKTRNSYRSQGVSERSLPGPVKIDALLYAQEPSAGALNDITSGNNDITGQIGGYQAGPGWDACTGWGSPNGTVLGQVLAGGGSGSGPGPGAPASGAKKKRKRPQRGGRKPSSKKSSKPRAGKKRSGRR